MPSWHVYEWSSLSHDLSPSASSKVDARSTIPFRKNIWLFCTQLLRPQLLTSCPASNFAAPEQQNACWPCYDYQFYQLSVQVHSQKSSASRSYVENMCPGLSKKACYRGGCSKRHERYCLPPHGNHFSVSAKKKS